MKVKNLFVFYLLATVLLGACGSNTADAVDNTGRKEALVKQASGNFESQEYHIPNELNYVKQKFDFVKAKFRPIGWSTDGKFAYIVEPAEEESGSYFFDFVIQDMNSDKLLYELRYNDQGAGESLTDVWGAKYGELKGELAKYKIIQAKPIQLTDKVFDIGNKHFEVKLNAKMKPDPDFLIDLVTNVKVVVVQGKDKKEALDEQMDVDDVLINVTSPGVILNPYGKKMAVVLQEERRGAEGPPNVLTIRLVGVAHN